MNNPAWILAQLAPVVVAYAETLTWRELLQNGDFRGLTRVIDGILECEREGDCDHPELCSIRHLEGMGELACMPYFHSYALATIPRNTPTWHAFLMFLRHYG